MARIRITLEDDPGRAIPRDKERVYAVPGGAKRLVDSEAALESCQQQAVPARAAKLVTLAQ